MTIDTPVRKKRRINSSDRLKNDCNEELRDTGIVSYPGRPIGDNQMKQQNEESSLSEYPSAFAISVVFGGAAGMSLFSALKLPAGGGFLLGFSCVFVVFLSLAVYSSLEDRRN